MIPRISNVKPMQDYELLVEFDSGEIVLYDVKEDIYSIDDFKALQSINGLFQQVQLDSSRTCIYWNDRIDLPSDIILEYGKPVNDSNFIKSNFQ